MKRIVFVLIVLYICTIAAYGQIKVTALKGDVQIRHGASETWQQVSVGDILKPDDSMKSGKLSSATVMLDDGKKLTVPEQVIVDISDLRNLTQEDFLLKLAMEQVRSISLPAQDQPLNLPSTTTLHGTQQGMSDITAKNP